MSQLVQIATSPGPYAVPADAFQGFVDRFVTDPVARRKLRFLAKESGMVGKHAILPDFLVDGSAPWLYDDPANPPSTRARMKVFEREAPAFAVRVARQCLDRQGLAGADLDAIVTVSCTGMVAPGLDVAVANALGMSHTAQRHAVNFMGCYAAFHGLRLAHLLCEADPQAKVLVVCVELCSLHFRNDSSDDNLLSTALFSDGAAAVLMTGDRVTLPSLARWQAFHSCLMPEGEQSMAWHVGDTGFEMVLKRDVPALVERQIAAECRKMLASHGLNQDDLAAYAIHPGGTQILRAFQQALDLKDEELAASLDVLRQCGNMSSCTVVFVLEKLLAQVGPGKRLFAAAFGPGFTMECGLLETVQP